MFVETQGSLLETPAKISITITGNTVIVKTKGEVLAEYYFSKSIELEILSPEQHNADKH